METAGHSSRRRSLPPGRWRAPTRLPTSTVCACAGARHAATSITHVSHRQRPRGIDLIRAASTVCGEHRASASHSPGRKLPALARDRRTNASAKVTPISRPRNRAMGSWCSRSIAAPSWLSCATRRPALGVGDRRDVHVVGWPERQRLMPGVDLEKIQRKRLAQRKPGPHRQQAGDLVVSMCVDRPVRQEHVRTLGLEQVDHPIDLLRVELGGAVDLPGKARARAKNPARLLGLSRADCRRFVKRLPRDATLAASEIDDGDAVSRRGISRQRPAASRFRIVRVAADAHHAQRAGGRCLARGRRRPAQSTATRRATPAGIGDGPGWRRSTRLIPVALRCHALA